MLALLGRILAKNDRILLIGSATDGQRAVRSASTLHLDLAVLDLHMPGLDGAEATRLLKDLPNPPTVFVVSSDDSFAARTRSLALGADAFVVKSMELAPELHAALKSFFTDDFAAQKAKLAHHVMNENASRRKIPSHPHEAEHHQRALNKVSTDCDSRRHERLSAEQTK